MSTTLRAPRPVTSAFLASLAAACLCFPAGIAAVAAEPSPGGPASPSASPIPSPERIPPGRPFSLSIGETGMLATGLEVTFIEVAEDSRCPLDVECVWEGDAQVVLLLASSSTPPGSLRLHTNARFATSASYDGHAVELVGLEPDPTTEGLPGPYRVTLLVTAAPPSTPSGAPTAMAEASPDA